MEFLVGTAGTDHRRKLAAERVNVSVVADVAARIGDHAGRPDLILKLLEYTIRGRHRERCCAAPIRP